MFSKRHYEAIARLIQAARKFNPDQRISHIEDMFVVLFARDNPKFLADRFRRACQPGANVRART